MANGESVDKEIIRGSRYSRSARWNGPSQSASLDVGGVGGSLGGEGGSCAVTGEREAVATNSSAARKGSGHRTLLPVLRSVAKSHMSPPTSSFLRVPAPCPPSPGPCRLHVQLYEDDLIVRSEGVDWKG